MAPGKSVEPGRAGVAEAGAPVQSNTAPTEIHSDSPASVAPATGPSGGGPGARNLTAALTDLGRGRSVIPLRPRDKKPALDSWERLQRERATEEEVKKWFAEDPARNVGSVTGAVSGIVVLDADGKKGEESLRGLDVPRTPTVLTGKGRHYYFAHPGREVPNATGLRPGLDLRGDGGYVVAPPSVHPNGKIYTWAPGLSPEEVPLAPCPTWLLERVEERKGPAEPIPEKITTGKRHPTLFSLAGSLRRRGAVEPEILEALRAINRTRCDPPLPDTDLSKMARDAGKYEPAQANTTTPETDISASTTAPGPALGPDLLPLTELGDAERLLREYGTNLKFCDAWGKWLVWDGRRWARDDSLEVLRLTQKMVRGLYALAANVADRDDRKFWLIYVAGLENRKALDNMVALARAGVAARPQDFDAALWLLNVKNGTLDLRTGELRPHQREDLLTKLAPVDYDPTATAPTWEAFLDTVLGRREGLKRYLKRVVGYGLTGDVSEHSLFFLYGLGANGKSTFLNAILRTLGDYARRAAPDLLMVKRNEAHPTERADLMGARLVVSIETEHGKKLAEVLVKDLTGGDRLKARYLYRDFFEFEPTFKIFLAANHKPVIYGTDYAIWRRIHLVPFDITIPHEKQDSRLGEKLLKEAPGILRWAVDGCLEWQRDGLGVPEEVKAATQAYREESDVLFEWLNERCETGPTFSAPVGDLYADYSCWCGGNNEEPLAKRTFGRVLEERGYPSVREGKARTKVRKGLWLIRAGATKPHAGDEGGLKRTQETTLSPIPPRVEESSGKASANVRRAGEGETGTPGKCPECRRDGMLLYPSARRFPICSRCDPAAAKAALEAPKP